MFSEELTRGPETHNADLHDLVVFNPQYLVDVLTRLIHIPEHLDVDREHSKQWKTLQEEGVANNSLLGHLWKDFDSPATELVAILEALGLLCPISSLAEAEIHEGGGMHEESEGPVTEINKYFVPFHLRETCLREKWQRLCRKNWTGICNSDKVLMLDSVIVYLLLCSIAKCHDNENDSNIVCFFDSNHCFCWTNCADHFWTWPVLIKQLYNKGLVDLRAWIELT